MKKVMQVDHQNQISEFKRINREANFVTRQTRMRSFNPGPQGTYAQGLIQKTIKTYSYN